MPVEEMRERMSMAEWVGWSAYFLKLGQQKKINAMMGRG